MKTNLLKDAIAFFAVITVMTWSVMIVPDISAQNVSKEKITITRDMQNFIISEQGNKQKNFTVYYNTEVTPVKCLEVSSVQNNEQPNIDIIGLSNKYNVLLSKFPDYLLCQLNNIYLFELYQIYTSPKKFNVAEQYINDYLMQTKVSTDDIVMIFKYDNDGKVKMIIKQERDYAQYRANRSLNDEFFKTYDKIEKFPENEQAFSLLSSD